MKSINHLSVFIAFSFFLIFPNPVKAFPIKFKAAVVKGNGDIRVAPKIRFIACPWDPFAVTSVPSTKKLIHFTTYLDGTAEINLPSGNWHIVGRYSDSFSKVWWDAKVNVNKSIKRIEISNEDAKEAVNIDTVKWKYADARQDPRFVNGAERLSDLVRNSEIAKEYVQKHHEEEEEIYNYEIYLNGMYDEIMNTGFTSSETKGDPHYHNSVFNLYE